MKPILPALALAAVAPVLAANQDAPQEPQAEPEVDSSPALDDPSVLDPSGLLALRANCRDMINHVREERGLPLIRRNLSDPEEPMLIRAVDYNVEGCDVLLTSTGPQPLPEIDPDAPLLRRAR